MLSSWPQCGEKEGVSVLEASAAETQTRSVNAGVENKGSLVSESL